MSASVEQLLAAELSMLWAAHRAVGLEGYMCLYSNPEQVPLRANKPGIAFWFGPEDTDKAVAQILELYRGGELPNTTLLLNPIVHKKSEDGGYTPVGSGIAWCTALCLGVDRLSDESLDRIWELGAQGSPFHRGDNERAGIKVVAFCDEMQPAVPNSAIVEGCKALYEISDLHSDQYMHYYLLSGLSYLSNNGLFSHPDATQIFPKQIIGDRPDWNKIARDCAVHIPKIVDAAYCWNAYERHHSLYKKFGTDVADVERNLHFFNLVARDVQLFDATGPMRKDADDMFEFLVPGLVPRGSITLLAASGGTGKSSLAHHLCIMAATDYEPGEEAPHWLGQRLAIEKCKGICIYFSGEDGPPIINARAAVFDPLGRARRLMFQRTDFGDGVTFAQHLRRLHKIPDVPLVVIDPARKFLSGDEDDAGVVSDFFEAIEEFAIQKGAAVMVLHHLQKGAYPASARETLDLLRGSQVFVDRPRVVIGMYRDGPYTIAGLAKNNIPPNMGMVMEERVFARDPKTLSLIWLPGDQGVRGAALPPEALAELAEKAKEEGRE